MNDFRVSRASHHPLPIAGAGHGLAHNLCHLGTTHQIGEEFTFH
jgi:hypothetical protein